MRMNVLRQTLPILVVLTSVVELAGAQQASRARSGTEFLIREQLTQAGYDPDSVKSMTLALRDADNSVAARAAVVLGQAGSTPESIAALRSVLNTDYDPLFYASAKTLQQFGDREWEPAALDRLPRMKVSASRLQVAGMLAEAGRGDGWYVIQEALAPGESLGLGGLAARYASHFAGLKDNDGRAIDVETTLERFQLTARPKDREEAQRTLAAIRQRAQQREVAQPPH